MKSPPGHDTKGAPHNNNGAFDSLVCQGVDVKYSKLDTNGQADVKP